MRLRERLQSPIGRGTLDAMTPRILIATAAAATILVGAGGCGGSSDQSDASDQASPTSSKSTSPSPSTSPPPLVSLSTSCQLLFPESAKSPLAQMVTMFTDPSVSTRQVEKAKEGIDTVTRVALSAQPELASQLTVIAKETQAVVDTVYEGAEHETTAMKAAGLEITRICQANL